MTIGVGVRKLLVYKKESTFGVDPGTGSAQLLRRVTSSVDLAKDVYQSNELRPEFVDSCLALFVHGGGEQERRLAHLHYLNMTRTSRAKYGYTILDDMTTLPMRKGDLCPGYWWAEQMKYYWLLFSDTPRFDYRNHYLSTEGKVLLGLR